MPNNASAPATGALLRDSAWQVQRRVVGALIIRELLTRYGRNNIGFLWLFVEPTIFIIVLALAWTAARGSPTAGIPIVDFAVTGYTSLLLWRGSVSRCMGALKSNKALLFHRQVTIMDIFTARILLEITAVTTALTVLGFFFWIVGWLGLPEDALEVLAGWLLLCWFSAGLALTIGALSEKFEVVARLWHPVQYLLMMGSGVAFIVDVLPPHAREIVLWVPMMNATEIIRDGWFGSQFTAHYDLPYLMACNIAVSLLGLALVRQIGFESDEE